MRRRVEKKKTKWNTGSDKHHIQGGNRTAKELKRGQGTSLSYCLFDPNYLLGAAALSRSKISLEERDRDELLQ